MTGYWVGQHRMFPELWAVYRPDGMSAKTRTGRAQLVFRDPSDALACALKLNRKEAKRG